MHTKRKFNNSPLRGEYCLELSQSRNFLICSAGWVRERSSRAQAYLPRL